MHSASLSIVTGIQLGAWHLDPPYPMCGSKVVTSKLVLPVVRISGAAMLHMPFHVLTALDLMERSMEGS
jgi:hypothetical protein